MAVTLTDSIVAFEVSDLDLLDDDRHHARCTRCTGPSVPLGKPFIALCGRRAVYLTDARGDVAPPNACEECKTLFGKPCRKCGATA